jgi:hypothetical protein
MNAGITATEATAPSTPNSAIARVPTEVKLGGTDEEEKDTGDSPHRK